MVYRCLGVGEDGYGWCNFSSNLFQYSGWYAVETCSLVWLDVPEELGHPGNIHYNVFPRVSSIGGWMLGPMSISGKLIEIVGED